MVRSMTGYGRAQQERGGRDITIEIKSVNARYFEYSSRMPRSFAFLDDRLKRLVGGAISRGKTELALTIVNVGAPEASISVNLELAKSYLEAMRAMSDALGVQDDVAVSTLARFSDVFTTRRVETNEEQLWQDVRAVAEAAVENFIAMRAAEGEKLKADILSRLETLERAVGEVEEMSARRVPLYKEKLYARLQALLADTAVDEARILTEAAIFADKTAVDEETVRLRSHLRQYRDILELGEPVGRKLDFLTQEMNRETNTIGSKAQELEITRKVVDMKAEIEQIREQIQNIEGRRGAGTQSVCRGRWPAASAAAGSARPRRKKMKLINIGFGNMVSANRLIAIVSPESAPIKRIVQEARDKGALIDATYGRRTRAVIITDSDHVILSAVQPETVANRLNDEEDDGEMDEDE